MYELTCPACHHKQRHSFVRAGAHATCLECKHLFQILSEQIHQTDAHPDPEGETPNPLLLGGTATKPPVPLRPQPVQPSATAPTPPQPTANEEPAFLTPDQDPTLHRPSPPKPPEPVQAMIASHRAKRHRKTTIYRMIITGVLVFMVILGTFYVLWMQRTDTADSTPSRATNIDPNMILLQAERLASPFWRTMDEPFDPPSSQTGFDLQPGTFVTRDDGSTLYLAELTVKSHQTAQVLIVHLSLIDSHNRVFAKAQQALALLGGTAPQLSYPQNLKVSVPKSLADRTIKVASYVEVESTLQSDVILEDPLVESSGTHDEAFLKITAYNPLSKALRRSVFAIHAKDANEDDLALWIVKWDRQTNARQRVEFGVRLPISPKWDIKRWEIIAVGEPLNNLNLD